MKNKILTLEEAQEEFWALVDSTFAKSKKAEENYGSDNHKVWELVTNNLYALWIIYVHPAILKSAQRLGIFSKEIPAVIILNKKLEDASGFRIFCCDGVLDFRILAYAYSQGYFPTTLFIRSLNQLLYIETPDMVHERVGHIVALSIKPYANVAKQFGEISLHYLNNEECVKALDKIHWWGIEFPLVWHEGKIKVVGPGILSSPGELVHSVTASNHPDTNEEIKRVTVTNENAFKVLMDIVLGPKHNIHIYQSKYLVFESFEVFEHALTKTLVLVMEEIKREKIVVPYDEQN